jgi:hypothetical protein
MAFSDVRFSPFSAIITVGCEVPPLSLRNILHVSFREAFLYMFSQYCPLARR